MVMMMIIITTIIIIDDKITKTFIKSNISLKLKWLF